MQCNALTGMTGGRGHAWPVLAILDSLAVKWRALKATLTIGWWRVARRSLFSCRENGTIDRVPQRIVVAQEFPITMFCVCICQDVGKRGEATVLALFHVAPKPHIDAHLDCDADRNGDDHVGREEDQKELGSYAKFH